MDLHGIAASAMAIHAAQNNGSYGYPGAPTGAGHLPQSFAPINPGLSKKEAKLASAAAAAAAAAAASALLPAMGEQAPPPQAANG